MLDDYTIEPENKFKVLGKKANELIKFYWNQDKRGIWQLFGMNQLSVQ